MSKNQHMDFRLILLLVALAFVPGARAAAFPELALRSAHAVVVDEATGEVLIDKDGSTQAPIASLTKLMTAMVVIDAQQDLNEELRIGEEDLDRLKHTRSGIRPGFQASRGTLLELALMASDNHAASALARHYPGGLPSFLEAVHAKGRELGLQQTFIEEPTGLSPNNRSTALDMGRIVRAAGNYPLIAEITSRPTHVVAVGGHLWRVKNTNHLVGAPGWNILTSKTGFTNEAGRCVSMRLQTAGRTVAVVLMGAVGASQRALDALNIRRWLAGEPPVTATVASASRAGTRAALRRHTHPAASAVVRASTVPAAVLAEPVGTAELTE